MIVKTCIVAMVAAGLAAGCSSVLGFKDPKLDSSGNQAPDAATDGATIDTPTDTGPAACMPAACPFGCDPGTNACRAAKLYVFATTGSYFGDGFGGKDNPPTVRATTDALCFATASSAPFMGRLCSRTRTHAVLFISAADSLALMATNYAIPTTAPVHRGDDDVLVANNWNDLIDTTGTKQPRAPVTTAASEPEGIVWSGANASSTCRNWTSEAPADSGVQGHTTLTSANWLNRGSDSCGLLARLLCVCWTGGQ